MTSLSDGVLAGRPCGIKCSYKKKEKEVKIKDRKWQKPNSKIIKSRQVDSETGGRNER